ncbi:helix-turn-helix domain-containing protein [Amycolatopsis sp. NPDC052450]|uniref:helix-turn-helix domain-containing protein n=1 Tax=Amycolatopsis sp. NPDC052450 TaxID=3363937 RepID=UPI0037CC01C6
MAATVATRARIVLRCAESRRKKDVAMLAGVSRPTVDLWLDRYIAEGIAGPARPAASRSQPRSGPGARRRAVPARRSRRGCRTGRAGRWSRSSNFR